MRIKQKQRDSLTEHMMAFFISTTGICILEGVLGMFFFPEQNLPYEAFFSPPIFGFLSVLCGWLVSSGKERSLTQIIVRRALHLFLIEGIVFGLNYMSGTIFPPLLTVVLAVSIAIVYIMVWLVLYINDSRNARLFNEELRQFQEREGLHRD